MFRVQKSVSSYSTATEVCLYPFEKKNSNFNNYYNIIHSYVHIDFNDTYKYKDINSIQKSLKK